MHYGNKYGAKYKYPLIEYQREYNSWYAMKVRCLDFMNLAFKRYGGRGITICDRWVESFDNFIDDMGRRPEGTTLDRIDGNGNYEPSNCRWATYKQQTLNTSTPNWIEDSDGDVLCTKDFAKKYKIHPTTLKYRLKKGMSIEDAKEKPKTQKMIVDVYFNGNVYGLRSLFREYGLPQTSICRWNNEGMTMRDAIHRAMVKKGMNVDASDIVVVKRPHEYKVFNDV